MCVCVCVRAAVWVGVRVCVCVCVRAAVCVWYIGTFERNYGKIVLRRIVAALKKAEADRHEFELYIMNGN